MNKKIVIKMEIYRSAYGNGQYEYYFDVNWQNSNILICVGSIKTINPNCSDSIFFTATTKRPHRKGWKVVTLNPKTDKVAIGKNKVSFQCTYEMANRIQEELALKFWVNVKDAK